MTQPYNALYGSPQAPQDNALYYDDTQGMPRQRPADPLRWLANAIGTNPDAAFSLRNMLNSGLKTSANWLDGTRDPSLIGPQEVVSPLGLAGMGMGVANTLQRAAKAPEKVWYHGTDAQFDALQPRAAPPYSGGSSVPATWLTSKPRVAQAFAEAGGQKGRVIDATVDAPNLEVVERAFRSPNWETMDPILQRAKEAGKDGVLFKRSQDHPDSIGLDPRVWNASDVIAMFNPEGIKPRGSSAMADNAKGSAPGLAANSTQQDDQGVMSILRRYGLAD